MTQPIPDADTPKARYQDTALMPISITRAEWDNLAREVHEIHTFIAEFAVRMESLGSAAGNPMALLQMISGSGKVKRRP